MSALATRPFADAAPAGSPLRSAGLTSAQVREERSRVGPNVLSETESPHWLLRFAHNFTHLFALLLWAGAALGLLAGQAPLSVAIVAVIVVNAVFSFAQEYRAERAVEAFAPGVAPAGSRPA